MEAVRWFEGVGLTKVALVGGKGANAAVDFTVIQRLCEHIIAGAERRLLLAATPVAGIGPDDLSATPAARRQRRVQATVEPDDRGQRQSHRLSV